MISACLCYTCNEHYLLPTVVSSLQARCHLSRALADVIVIVVDGFADPQDNIAKLLNGSGVRLKTIDRRQIEGLGIHFARHFLDCLLEPQYTKVIHIDSDTQITDSLDPLFEVALPAGYLMASPDPMSVRLDEHINPWSGIRRYLKSIGLKGENVQEYINTGLFGGARGDLASASRECVKLCCAQATPFRWIEQDGINIVAQGRFKHLSFKWNFPSFLLNSDVNRLIQPHIHHFMSNPRPWQGPFRPWGAKPYEVYLEHIDREPDLKPFYPKLGGFMKLKYRLQQKVKAVVHDRAWRDESMLPRFAAFEERAIV